MLYLSTKKTLNLACDYLIKISNNIFPVKLCLTVVAGFNVKRNSTVMVSLTQYRLFRGNKAFKTVKLPNLTCKLC